ncbi:LysR family transcriptional regulator [Reinekea sp. G2M2-21]|uniref:LysR family transcriptional regulator n=1 Tax=Reinekea sp. G2M2-21 TaxID=2788942 RepID=UPI0018A962DE|nr:LysR family transcriptional regulator [Reinekea sp. G2M2-21]
MFAQMESLIVFANSDSMADAAARLRVSQSALSKRIRALEQQLGYPLLEHQGRRAVLTVPARQLLQDLEPLMAQMADVLRARTSPDKTRLGIALADAIMVSWGAVLMADLAREFPDISFDIHSHRTAVIVERLSRGRYQMGICTGNVSATDGLVVMPLVDEPMSIICGTGMEAQFVAWQRGATSLEVCCIEQKSAMWAFLAPHFDAWHLSPVATLESSVGVARLAAEGYCHALVPSGVANVIAPVQTQVRLQPGSVSFPVQGRLERPCSLVSRKTVINHPVYSRVYQYIQQRVAQLVLV